jgi:predicted Zn-dependent peptidase
MRATVRVPLVLAAALGLPASLAQAQGAAPTAASITPPALGAVRPLVLPQLVERTLPNGLRLVIVEHHELPVLDAVLVVRTGPEADPAAKMGLATLTAIMLDEGAGGRDALAIADQAAFLAIGLRTGANFEQGTVTLHTTTATRDSALALMADVALRPAFAQKDFDRLKQERLAALLQEQDRGPALADRGFTAMVFGLDHPFGRSANGSRETVEAITREDVAAFWRSWYRPNNATLVLVGDLTVPQAEALARRHFGAWERAPLPTLAAYPVPRSRSEPRATTVTIVDRPKAAQSSFRIGGLGVTRGTPDYYPLMVMNTMLGGSFTSRLNTTLREKKGYTYGASSAFLMRRTAGSFVAFADVASAKTDSALIEFLRELKGIREAAPAEELAKVKRYLQLGYAEGFETPAAIAAQVAALVPAGIPLATLGAYQARIGAVTAADVQRVARRYVTPDSLTIVIAGDRARIEAGLKAANVAPVEVRDSRGRPAGTP